MKDLFKAELLRFRVWLTAAVVVHLAVLAFLARVMDLAQQSLMIYRIFAGVYMLAGLLFGMYQMGRYRRANVWLNLLHRPLSPRRIALALFGAGCLALVLAIAVPILLIAVSQAGMTARVVDLRHWLLPLAASFITVCGYLAGGLAMLGNRRWSACGLVFLMLLVVAEASGWMALLVQALATLWLAVLVAIAFKPDLAAPPRSALGMAAMALPAQVGVYVLILLLGFGIEMLWIMQGSHPTNRAVPPHNGPNEAERMTGQQRMLAGLVASTYPQAPLWREQVGLSQVYGIGQQVRWQLQRGALTGRAAMEFEDGKRQLRWVFSHDRMRYEGYGIATGQRVGEMGAGSDNAAFPAPSTRAAGALPGLADGDAALIAGNTLYHYVSESEQVLPRVQVPAGELLTDAEPVGETLVVSSDRAMYFIDGNTLAESEALVPARLRLPVPGRNGDLRSVDVMELVDGYLLSFSFTQHPSDPLGAPPYQTVLWLHDDGHASVVAQRAMPFDFPTFYRYKAWWPSPALYTIRMAATTLFATPDPLQATSPAPTPRSMWMLAGVLMLVSLLAAWWILRQRQLPTRSRVAWIIACGAIGVPALVSLWLFYPERTTHAGAGAELASA